MSDKKKEDKLMAKPIESTPVLKGQDLIDFVHSLAKKDSEQSNAKRQSALTLLKRIRK
jgi:hypothetical protein